MKQIIIVTPNSLSKDDKKKLADDNILIIEHKNPNDVRIVNQFDGLESDEVVMSAVEAPLGSNSGNMLRSDFAYGILRSIKNRKK